MQRIRLGIYDEDKEYSDKLTAYLLSKEEAQIEPHVYSDLAHMLSDLDKLDICLSSDAWEQPDLESRGKVVLLDDRDDNATDYPRVNKYQSMTALLAEVRRLAGRDSALRGGESAKITVVCSPIYHELQMLFSMCMCREWSIHRKTLYVNLREFSGFSSLFEGIEGNDFEDYLLSLDTEKGSLEDYVHLVQGVSLLLPPRRPEVFWEMSESMFTEFLDRLNESGYEEIVIDLGGCFPGSFSLLSRCERIIGLTKEGFLCNRMYREWEEAMSFHLGEAFLKKMTKVVLPLQSGGMTDSPYLLEEIYRGNLGDFIRELQYE